MLFSVGPMKTLSGSLSIRDHAQCVTLLSLHSCSSPDVNHWLNLVPLPENECYSSCFMRNCLTIAWSLLINQIDLNLYVTIADVSDLRHGQYIHFELIWSYVFSAPKLCRCETQLGDIYECRNTLSMNVMLVFLKIIELVALFLL